MLAEEGMRLHRLQRPPEILLSFPLSSHICQIFKNHNNNNNQSNIVGNTRLNLPLAKKQTNKQKLNHAYQCM